MSIKQSLVVLVFAVLFVGCANKKMIRPGDSLEVAFEKAQAFYERGKWTEAAGAFETVLSMGRGTAIAEEAQFLLAESYYNNGEFLLAASEYERFMAYYPRSSILELCAFKEAKCYYELSPRYKLDQTDTEKAIEKFQLFVRRYSNAALADSAIALIDMMRVKLAHKEFDAGKLYKRLGQYQAAAIYFGLTMDKYPETSWAEKALSEQVHSYLLLAENSVPDKREERYQSVVDTYEKYVQIFPRGDHRTDVEAWVDEARVALSELRGSNS